MFHRRWYRIGAVIFFLLALLAPLSVGSGAAIAAAQREVTCENMASREQAQAFLDFDDETFTAELDPDENGTACDHEEFFGEESTEESTEATEEPSDDPLATRLGGERDGFEDEYGEPADDADEDDFAVGVVYDEVDGYDAVNVFWDEDIAAHITLSAEESWSERKALELAERFLPADIELEEASSELDDGELLFLGQSEALADAFDQDRYDTYEVGGEPGDLRVILVPDDAGDVTTIDLAIGAGEEYGGGGGQTSGDEDVETYLTTVRDEVDTLSESVDRFDELVAQGANASDEDFDELISILTDWINADATAQDLTPPEGYEDLHETYTDMTAAFSGASVDFTSFLISGGEDDSLLDSGAEQLDTATGLLDDLDQLLTDEGF